MKFRLFVLFLILFSLGFVAQQYASYTSLREELSVLKEESERFVTLIEQAMFEESTILKQLKETEQRHHKLRILLPKELQEEAIEQQVAKLAKKYRIKVLATKTAINSRSFYQEATLNITLEASDLSAKKFIRKLKSMPRLINIVTPKRRGKKSIHLSISVYARTQELSGDFDLPHCIDMPTGILLPPLHERLASLYTDYSRHCRYISNYSELYLKLLRIRTLQEDISQLQAIIDKLTAANK
ncbi:MAG: hypothetical protein ABFS08_13465 [Pseudomonadota bacterium]